MTKRQRWATKRNWLIRRLKGAQSMFSYDSCQFMYSLLPKDQHRLVTSSDIFITLLIKEISKSKYKGV